MTDNLSSDKIEAILTIAATAAIDGTMTDNNRVAMYRLAMTVTANELHRIEQNAPGTVSPESLILLHQVALLCDPDVTKEKLFGSLKKYMGVPSAEEEETIG